MNHKMLTLFSLLTLEGLTTQCTPTFQGEYSDPTTVEIIDDRWNETDARKTSEVLIRSMLEKPWFEEFKREHKQQRPILFVGDVENRTDEHIDTKAIIEAITNEVLNSGKMRFVNVANRDQIVKEMEYQQKSGMVSKETMKQKGKQIGADFMISGGVSSQVHTQDGLKTVSYQTVLQLTNLETAEIVWKEKYDLKKRFNRSGSKW